MPSPSLISSTYIRKFLFLFLTLLLYTLLNVSYALEPIGMEPPHVMDSTNLQPLANATPMTYKAKISNNDCYSANSTMGSVDANTNTYDLTYSPDCKSGYVAMANGSSLQILDTIEPWGKLANRGVKSLASRRNTRCCRIIYVWEQA